MVAVLLGMFGWAVYDFTNDLSREQANEEVSAYSDEEGSTDEKVGLEVENQAPDFHLQTLDGKEVRLSDYRGKRVMVNFWTTWCPPCRAEMPDMEKFYQEKDIEILAVNLTESESSVKNVTNFVQEFNLTFPIILDKENVVGTQYRIRPIPTSYMIDANGIIHFKTFGPMNYEMMVQEFEKMK